MRLCQGLLCDNAADLFWHGPWCAACATKQFGRVPAEMFKLETREVAQAATPARPQGSLPPSDPVLGAGAGLGCLPAPAPSFTEAELLDTLATHGLLDPIDLEFELLQRLEAE